MTRKQVEMSVRWWQDKLGLALWQIDVVWPEDYYKWREDNPNWDKPWQHAFIWRARDYESARLYLNPSQVDNWTMKEGEENIIHELLHLVTQPLEHILDLLDDRLQKDVLSLIDEQYRHDLEGVVDNLARRLLELSGRV